MLRNACATIYVLPVPVPPCSNAPWLVRSLSASCSLALVWKAKSFSVTTVLSSVGSFMVLVMLC